MLESLEILTVLSEDIKPVVKDIKYGKPIQIISWKATKELIRLKKILAHLKRLFDGDIDEETTIKNLLEESI